MAEEWSSWAPILRVKDAQVSAKFYREAMGFRVDWEHRFADGFPLYMQISRSPLVLHVSEHQGGGTTAAEFFVRVPMWMPSIGRLWIKGSRRLRNLAIRSMGCATFMWLTPTGTG